MFILNRFRDLISLLYPELCVCCGISLIYSEKIICLKCFNDLPFTDFHTYSNNLVAKQLWGRISFNAAMAMLYFRKENNTQKLIHHLKYKGRKEVGVFLGSLLAERIIQQHPYNEIDLIIPVPLHPKRLRKRGYNQSMSICEGIGNIFKKQVSDKFLIRKMVTESQTRKGRFFRFENMQSVFCVPEANLVSGRKILLIDDVFTTGATVEACAMELLKHGAKSISIATLAYTS